MDWPKCTWHEGGRYCKDGKITWAPFHEDSKPFITDEDCPACHGTGERDLTADEADVFLRANKCCWWPKYEIPNEVAIQIELYEFTGMVTHKNFGVYAGYNLTAALNAAARAVRERRKG